jgi:translation initiation factor IF-2
MQKENKQSNKKTRPPVVVVMGHVDHGKSTLLDYIRKTNVVDSEVGGITQRISAYEVLHRGEKGQEQKITFLDTPGHEAFSKMRERGARVADIAILVVSAEDGVKPQTVEAFKAITEAKLPFVVAINKVDKPGANVEKTKIELAENEIYLENFGGKTPFAEISAKTGAGVDNLLSLVLILAELENWEGDPALPASGFVIESHLDSKRGIEASLIIKDGSLEGGMWVAAHDALVTTRMIENFKGEAIKNATFSSPIRLAGWTSLPVVGSEFKSFKNKRDAEEYAAEQKNKTVSKNNKTASGNNQKKMIPIVLKADVAGSLEAIEKEIGKIQNENAEFKVIARGTGPITESDIKNIASEENVLIIAFNVKTDKSARELAEKRGMSVYFFDIIYKISEWLATEMEARRPRIETVETTGKAKIIRAFSRTKERQIVGGKVMEGVLVLNGVVKILRRDFEIGRGKIVNLEKSKVKVKEVEAGSEFGMMIESKMEIVAGDVLESFSVVQK